MKQERRYKFYMMDENNILAMLNWNTFEYISLPITSAIPFGAYIVSMNYDQRRACWFAKVYHESFDIIQDGECIPIAEEWINVECRSISIKAYEEACLKEVSDYLKKRPFIDKTEAKQETPIKVSLFNWDKK